MVKAGKSVCVLELGKEIWPGEYPHTFKGAMREYSLSGRILGKMISIGKAAGLYHTVKGEGQDVFLGCGVGGTSLINAGVFLKPDERLLEAAEWPEEIRENPAGLEQCEY
jgi:choline dehydrogenase-like flavoprotein